MSISVRLKSVLETNHIPYSLIAHTPTYSAQFAAAVMHEPGKDVAKTVVLRSGKNNLIALLPAPCHVNLQKLAAAAGGPVSLIEEQECNKLFPDCEPGAVPPFGELYGLPVYMDATLAADPEIILSAGTHSDALRMLSADFIRLVRPKVCAFAERS
ncbi:MAG: YbaK/EbsC family protein [Acidobacteriia bacterium]|nr:YbaK/EbsC family protein [Terriglobia bacterium]